GTSTTCSRWRVAALRASRLAVLRFRGLSAYCGTPSHVALPVANNLSLPHREGRCAAQQKSLSIGSYGSTTAVTAAHPCRPLNPNERTRPSLQPKLTSAVSFSILSS